MTEGKWKTEQFYNIDLHNRNRFRDFFYFRSTFGAVFGEENIRTVFGMLRDVELYFTWKRLINN
jgi:hypothetical protein